MRFFNHISLDNLRGDLFGGMTAAVVSLPLALAFGVASGAGPEAGLWGAVIVGLFAAVFGGTPTLISEPTGPMTVVMAAVVTTMVAAHPEGGLAMAFTVVMIAGLFQMAMGALRLGKYITLMPYSVISGFMSGIGVILIILQIAPFLGQAAPAGGVLGTVRALPQLIQGVSPIELSLGIFTLLVLFLTPQRVRGIVPPELAALLFGTVFSLVLFGDADVRRIGVIPTGLPSLNLPVFTPALALTMLADGIVLGLLGCIDALLTAVIADSLTRTEHDSDKELIGQGMGNFFAGLFGGLPGAGATMGTVVNIQTGARTAVSGIARALILLLVVLGAARLTEVIPLAVLAGIALKVGLNILDWSFLQRAHKVSVRAALIMYSVMLLTVFIDLIVAVGVGVFIANVITIDRLSQHQAKNVKAISDADDAVVLGEAEKQLLDRAQGRVLLFYLSGPMIFAVSRAIARQQAAIDRHRCMVIDLSDVPVMDLTVSLAIENAIKGALEAGLMVFVVSRNASVQQRLARLGIFDRLPAGHLLPDRLTALEKAVAVVEVEENGRAVQGRSASGK